MKISSSEKLEALKKAGYQARLRRPKSLLDAIEAGDDGTSRDESLRHIAAELMKVGLVRREDRFISSYDVLTDAESFLPVVRR